jgi:heat shock protein HslJ
MLFKKITLTTSALAIFFLIAGCQNTKPVIANASGGSEMLFMHQWNLTELKGKNVVITTGTQPQLLFFPGQVNRVSGSTGCNKLNGSFVLSAANTMKFSSLVTTKMACVRDNVESQFLEVLGKVNSWAIINKQLVLKNGKVIMAKLNAVTA